MTSKWQTGNPGSRAQTLFPKAHGVNCYGRYKRRHENFTEAQKIGVAARASSRKRKPSITLADKPFDWRGDQ